MFPRVLVNSKPLKKSPSHGVTTIHSSVDNFIKTSENTTFGVVIWKRNDCAVRGGRIGEVLAQENFEDASVHFIFHSTTQTRFNEESDVLGIGSLVQISWARNLTARMDDNHVIVYIEKMFVYKCQMLMKSEIFVVHNSQSMPGISIGMNEQNVEVVFHPSCSSKIRKETFRAAQRNMSEFSIRSKFLACERVKRMVNAWLVVAPFTIDVSGSFAKIRFFVIQKISNDNDFEENAVITNIARKMFMEAKYLSKSESIIFNAKACHSNILSQISVGSIVRVKSSTTFKSSRYHWYGYDVTIDKYRRNSGNNHNNVKKKDDRRVLEENYRQSLIEDLKDSTDKEVNLINMDEKEKCEKIEFFEPKKHNNDSYLPLNTAGKNFKTRYHLLGKCILNSKPFEVPYILNSYRDPSEYIEDQDLEKRPDSQMIERIRNALKEHNLLKNETMESVFKREVFEENEEKVEKCEKTERIPKYRKEFTIEKIVEVLGTVQQSKTLEETFVLPDTNWKPRERRVVGLHDDLQWVLMGTFVLSKEEVEEMVDQEEDDNKKLLGGWWYRRSVPRESPIQIVEKLQTCRNILEDCTREL